MINSDKEEALRESLLKEKGFKVNQSIDAYPSTKLERHDK